ncbi:hypothetical protein [Paenibacillus glucanolyticus]
MNTQDIQLRDPYILPDSKHKKYYMYGTTKIYGGKETASMSI